VSDFRLGSIHNTPLLDNKLTPPPHAPLPSTTEVLVPTCEYSATERPLFKGTQKEMKQATDTAPHNTPLKHSHYNYFPVFVMIRHATTKRKEHIPNTEKPDTGQLSLSAQQPRHEDEGMECFTLRPLYPKEKSSE
jgi:hypothetical protein